jgi:general secretion pathway protein K
MARVAVDPEARDQITVLTRFFDLRVDVELGGSRAVRTALLEARSDGRVHTVIQRWTPEE